MMSAQTVVGQVVRVDCMDSLRIDYITPRLQVHTDTFSHLNMEGYRLAGAVGGPSVPVRSDLLTVPFCDSIVVGVSNMVCDTIPLLQPPAPIQPQLPRGKHRIFMMDTAAYLQPGYQVHPLVEVQRLGVARDRNLALLHYSPVWVNTQEHSMIVCRSASITIRYLHADAALTLDYYSRYHTQAFNPASSINTLVQSKNEGFCSPVRLTVLAIEPLRCKALDDFVEWKRTQGLLVDLVYIAPNLEAEQVASKIVALFDAADVDNPAPAYLLLVGDYPQMPAFLSNLSQDNIMHDDDYMCDNHITDHYFTTITDDMMPDCHRGRFPAADTVQLRNMIEKTLFYERYLFADDSYLARAALVAGVDRMDLNDTNDWAYSTADPAMDYISYHYINSEHGFADVTYYKNNYNYAPLGITVTGSSRPATTGTALRDLYTEGVGWINYSAHGDETSWARPQFYIGHVYGDTTLNNNGDTVRSVHGMNNFGKPSVIIGNCCLSAHFDTPECLGEALIRRGKKAGAVTYIGCSNSSFWVQDFYWMVGVRNQLSNRMDLGYKAAYTGAYDHLFHTHGEPLSQRTATAGALLTAGIMEVNNAPGNDRQTRSMAEYYWELYHLFGDPTLMPWLGKADELTDVGFEMQPDESRLAVKAPYGAYVALVQKDSLRVVTAGFVQGDGYAYLPLVDTKFDSCFFSITAQGYKPWQKDVADASLGAGLVNAKQLTVSPNPASSSCEVQIEGLREVSLFDVLGVCRMTLSATGDRIVLPLQELPTGLYLLQVQTTSGVLIRKLVVR